MLNQTDEGFQKYFGLEDEPQPDPQQTQQNKGPAGGASSPEEEPSESQKPDDEELNTDLRLFEERKEIQAELQKRKEKATEM